MGIQPPSVLPQRDSSNQIKVVNCYKHHKQTNCRKMIQSRRAIFFLLILGLISGTSSLSYECCSAVCTALDVTEFENPIVWAACFRACIGVTTYSHSHICPD